ncbi:hypothetical protein DFQ28_007467 [Apophysomyces sp. BC1034]|nr:hypothetical protein DFQ30_004949 [Apophysomyces sp. BC1015]KAG0182400.1 hypothetical protein DFQ29_004453 [Apophysomyces sp. BC1021]KAG0192857.1 hypothetical protein DFQ28_007467 [Apophysomyces sp. BC1034]
MKTRADQFTFKEYDFDEDQRIYSRLGDVPGNRSTSDSNKMAASTLAPSPVFTPQAALKPDTPSWDEVPPATEEFHLVIHPYPAQLADELMLQIGDIVYLSTRFDDGWAVGYNVATGLRGVFPLICTVLASSDLMDDLLQGETSSKTLVEHGQSPLLRQCQLPSQQQQFTLRMARIRENLQRSRSLGVLSHMLPRSTPPLAHHNTIPKRAASMRAPPFTDVTPLSSALVRPRNVERHALVETQKPDEVYELHQQNHH